MSDWLQDWIDRLLAWPEGARDSYFWRSAAKYAIEEAERQGRDEILSDLREAVKGAKV